MLSYFESAKKQAAYVRDIKLHQVLEYTTGTVMDKKDPARWHTEQGSLSVNGQKFFNWTKNIGGGGAIEVLKKIGVSSMSKQKALKK